MTSVYGVGLEEIVHIHIQNPGQGRTEVGDSTVRRNTMVDDVDDVRETLQCKIYLDPSDAQPTMVVGVGVRWLVGLGHALKP